ncbi:uncharacterized protein LOC106720286 [Papilio machaon]|uniref:uncharacterized protein LOC106720286 n=1 Tax=Papilio machaon TaxID=76193 RepID=UPI001E66395D|nr:uncharacterized protein LOC106720286 [Papilio machaon]
MATKERMINFVSEAQYQALVARYVAFVDAMGDPAQPVVRVNERLSPRHLQELQLVREISEELQKKKHDDMKKAAAKAANIN